jgi:hypothetical protein
MRNRIHHSLGISGQEKSHNFLSLPPVDVITDLNVIRSANSTQAKVNDNTERFPVHTLGEFLQEYPFAGLLLLDIQYRYRLYKEQTEPAELAPALSKSLIRKLSNIFLSNHGTYLLTFRNAENRRVSLSGRRPAQRARPNETAFSPR